MHARKTRQRKKEQMQHLQGRADDLKKEQIRLRQTINDTNTASILVGLFSIKAQQRPATVEDPMVEQLLRRPIDSIPDATKIPELPALILPGHHSKRSKALPSSFSPDKLSSSGMSPAVMTSLVTSSSSASAQAQMQENGSTQFPDDGIDYELLGKDRSKCSPQELDQIRRERNRMHAKRTRDRKRMFMEEMEGIIKTLEKENAMLQRHLDCLGIGGGGNTSAGPAGQLSNGTDDTPRTPEIESEDNDGQAVTENTETDTDQNPFASDSLKRPLVVSAALPLQGKAVPSSQLMSLLEAAEEYDNSTNKTSQASSSEATAVSSSDCSEGEPNDSPTTKRRKVSNCNGLHSAAFSTNATSTAAGGASVAATAFNGSSGMVPASITTANHDRPGC